MRPKPGVTLIEIAPSVFIFMLLLLLAVPSLQGVLADRQLRRSFDSFNDLVRQAEELSVKEQRSYLIVWAEKKVTLRPDTFVRDEEVKATAELDLGARDVLKLRSEEH